MRRAALLLAAEAPTGTPAGPLVRVLLDPDGAMRRALAGLRATLEAAGPRLLLLAGAVAIAAVAVLALRRSRRARMQLGAHVVTVLAPPDVDASGGEALWRNLHDVLRPRWRGLVAARPHVSFEYAWTPDGLSVSLWVPGCVPVELVERAAAAAWPGATTKTAEFQPTEAGRRRRPRLTGEFRLAMPGWLPLRTDFDADPLRAMIGAAHGTGAGESTAVLVLARPAHGRAVTRCRRAARDLRTGRPPTPALRLLDLFTPGPAAQRSPIDPSTAPEIRAIVTKSESPLWAVRVRYAVASGPAGDGPAGLPLKTRAHAVTAAFGLYTGRNRLVRRPLRGRHGVFDGRVLSRGDLLSTPELAALAHLPTDRIVPALSRASARPVAPPPGIESIEAEGKVLGDSDAGGDRPVVLRPADARYHVHVMGATGSGKSTLLTNMILEDVEHGRGVVVIDPKGDLVADVRDRLKQAPEGGLVVLDPTSAEGRPTLNVLEVPEGVSPDLVVDHVVGVFSRIFEHHWGPRLEDVLRSACLTLLLGRHDADRPAATLSSIPELLSDLEAHKCLLGPRTPGELTGFWQWYSALNEGQRAQVVGPLLYKLRAFLLRPYIRQIVEGDESSFDIGRVLDGGLLLVRVPKGELGEDTARLLGSFVVAKTWQAATARARRSAAHRTDAAVYVDECQNFVTTLPRSFDEVLAESRGYGVSWVLAHQHLGQLPRDLRDAVSANARNKVLFNMSPEDAFVLSRHTSPRLAEHDLANLAAYQAAVRLVVAGQDKPAFTMKTRPAPQALHQEGAAE
ncbi:MAG: hypothetical protein QOK43_2889 [Acidimicrobiaceae bacterium]|nr:hypothetical protein [Acidimicrobiaceae bacterium]